MLGRDGGGQPLSPGAPGEAGGSASLLCVLRLRAWSGCLGRSTQRLCVSSQNTQRAAWKGKVSASFPLFWDCPARWGAAACGAREEPPPPSSPFQFALVPLALLCISGGSGCCCLLLLVPGDSSAPSIWRRQPEQTQTTPSPRLSSASPCFPSPPSPILPACACIFSPQVPWDLLFPRSVLLTQRSLGDTYQKLLSGGYGQATTAGGCVLGGQKQRCRAELELS